MSSLRIDADELGIALESHDPEITHYLNLQTGEIVPVFDTFEPGDEEYVDAEEMAESPHFLRIEPISSREGWRWMRDFTDQVSGSGLRERLDSALQRRRPFRHFKDVLLDAPEVRAAWFRYHEARLLEAARAWLREAGIEAELEPPARDAQEDAPPLPVE